MENKDKERRCIICGRKIDALWAWKNLCSYQCSYRLVRKECDNYYEGKEPSGSHRYFGGIHDYLEASSGVV